MPYGLEFFEQLPYADFYQVCQILELEERYPEASILLQMLARNAINQQAKSLLYLQVYFLCAELGVLEAEAESLLQNVFFRELYGTTEKVLASLVAEKLKVVPQEITRYEACVRLAQAIKDESTSSKMEKVNTYTAFDQASCRETLRFILNLQACGVAVPTPVAWENNEIHFAEMDHLVVLSEQVLKSSNSDSQSKTAPREDYKQSVSTQSEQVKTLAHALTKLGYKITSLSEAEFHVDNMGCIWLVDGYDRAFAQTKNPNEDETLSQLQNHFGLTNVLHNKETYLQSITGSLPDEADLSSLLEYQTDDDIIDVTTSSSQEYSADSCDILDY